MDVRKILYIFLEIKQENNRNCNNYAEVLDCNSVCLRKLCYCTTKNDREKESITNIKRGKAYFSHIIPLIRFFVTHKLINIIPF